MGFDRKCGEVGENEDWRRVDWMMDDGRWEMGERDGRWEMGGGGGQVEDVEMGRERDGERDSISGSGLRPVRYNGSRPLSIEVQVWAGNWAGNWVGNWVGNWARGDEDEEWTAPVRTVRA